MNSIDSNFIKRFLHSFKYLGGNEFGYVDYQHFKEIMNQVKDVDAKDIFRTIEKEHHVKDCKLDFVSLCASILTTKAYFNRVFKENGRTPNSMRATSDYSVGKKCEMNQYQEVRKGVENAMKKICCKSLKGMIFNYKGGMFGYRYYLEVLENSKVEISARALSANGKPSHHVPIEVLVFQGNNTKMFLTSSTMINNEGHCSIKCTLRKGNYILVPICLKPTVPHNTLSEEKLILESLINIDGDSNVTLTTTCHEALRTVFDAIDLDGNGFINHLEFDYFIQYTSGETATDEWTTIEDNFCMEHGELTFAGFLEMYLLVLKTDPSDVVHMFEKMGINASMNFSKSHPYILSIKSDKDNINLKSAPISSYAELAKKALCKMTVEQGLASKIRQMNDLLLYTHHLPFRTSLVLQNQSHSKVKVRLDCSTSTNCVSHKGSLDCCIEISPRASVIGHHLFPDNILQEMDITCTETLM